MPGTLCMTGSCDLFPIPIVTTTVWGALSSIAVLCNVGRRAGDAVCVTKFGQSSVKYAKSPQVHCLLAILIDRQR